MSADAEINGMVRTSFRFLQDRQACKKLKPQTTEQPIYATMRPTWFLRRAVRAALVDALGMVASAGVVPAEDLARRVAITESKGLREVATRWRGGMVKNKESAQDGHNET